MFSLYISLDLFMQALVIVGTYNSIPARINVSNIHIHSYIVLHAVQSRGPQLSRYYIYKIVKSNHFIFPQFHCDLFSGQLQGFQQSTFVTRVRKILQLVSNTH